MVGEEGRETAKNKTARAEHLGIKAVDGDLEAHSDDPTKMNSQGISGSIEVDHIKATPQETCTTDKKVESVKNKMSQLHSEMTHQYELVSIAQLNTFWILLEDPRDTMGDEECHPVTSTELSKIARSTRVGNGIS